MTQRFSRWSSPRCAPAAARQQQRAIHSRRTMKDPIQLPRALVAHFPIKQTAPTPPPTTTETASRHEEEAYHTKTPVTSAHAIDRDAAALSHLDSVMLEPTSGDIVHGRYGTLAAEAVVGVPLEYLALLRMAAEGAAGVAKLVTRNHRRPNGSRSSRSDGGGGTVLVYGASQANGLAAVQMAAAAPQIGAVVGIVDGQHSCHEDLLEYVKGMIPEPGTAVGQEYALVKQNFRELVDSIASGEEGLATATTAEDCLADFQTNLVQYADVYPDTRPAAVDANELKFLGMEKDKEQFSANMDAYLSQYPPGSPPMDAQQVHGSFSTESYAAFRHQFWEQTTRVISGDESHVFSPPHLVQELLQRPPSSAEPAASSTSTSIPFAFDSSRRQRPVYPTGTEATPGGPVLGAIIAVTPELQIAAETVAAAASAAGTKGSSLRAKAEALHYLTDAQQDAFAAATSVAAQATNVGAPVVTIGGTLPGFDTAEPTDVDVQTALSAMAIQDDGTTNLEYFIQTYRAGDFPFYADYAVHRATEVLAGPRQIVVTK